MNGGFHLRSSVFQNRWSIKTIDFMCVYFEKNRLFYLQTSFNSLGAGGIYICLSDYAYSMASPRLPVDDRRLSSHRPVPKGLPRSARPIINQSLQVNIIHALLK